MTGSSVVERPTVKRVIKWSMNGVVELCIARPCITRIWGTDGMCNELGLQKFADGSVD